MSEMKVIQKNWPWTHQLDNREITTYIVVHHTACTNQMEDVNDIEKEHLAEGWAGIGYHRVIKGDGTTVQGRPDKAVGAHAYRLNYCSVGISLEGWFHPPYNEQPTPAQIQALKDNLKDLLAMFPDCKIIGHRDVAGIVKNSDAATACPGDILYAMLPDIIKEVTGK
jgi:hypothetical protein